MYEGQYRFEWPQGQNPFEVEHGRGKLTYPNGDFEEGEWLDGDLIRGIKVTHTDGIYIEEGHFFVGDEEDLLAGRSSTLHGHGKALLAARREQFFARVARHLGGRKQEEVGVCFERGKGGMKRR